MGTSAAELPGFFSELGAMDGDGNAGEITVVEEGVDC